MRYAFAGILILLPVCAWAQGRVQSPSVNSGADTDSYWSPQNRVNPELRQSGAPPVKAFGAMTEKEFRDEEVRKAQISERSNLAEQKNTPGEGYIRSLLDYDIVQECRNSISSMQDAIADGRVVPERAIPNCISRDKAALDVMSRHWNTAPQQKRESCLAAFGKGGKSNAFRYMTIAQCVGLYKP